MINKKIIISQCLILSSLLTPITAFAIETVPINITIAPTLMDLTVSDSITVKTAKAQVNAEVSRYIVKNNNQVGVVHMKSMEIQQVSPYSLVSYNQDFTVKSIDSKQFALKYQNHDFTQKYTDSQAINPTSTLEMDLDGKLTISSTDENSVHIADVVSTFEYTETKWLSDLSVSYSQPDGETAITTIDKNHLNVTVTYSDNTQRQLSSSEYTIQPSELTGKGEESVTITYSENGVTKTGQFTVQNPYTINLFSDTGNSQLTYKYGTGKTLPILERSGYTFKGWFTNSQFTGSTVTSVSAFEKGNKAFYAKWEKLVAPTMPVVNSISYPKYDVNYTGFYNSFTEGVTINASTSDAGTLSYSWDVKLNYKGEMSTKTYSLQCGNTNTIAASELNKYIGDGFIYASEYSITGSCTITNSLNGMTESKVVSINWTGTY